MGVFLLDAGLQTGMSHHVTSFGAPPIQIFFNARIIPQPTVAKCMNVLRWPPAN